MIKKILALSLAASFAMTGFAQHENMTAFKNLGVGLEVGVMGSGFQFSMPVVDNHLVAVVGMNSYILYGLDKIDYDINLTSGRINNGIDKLNKEVIDFNAKPANAANQLPTVNGYMPDEFTVTMNGEMKPSFKFLLEYYPSESSTFHITGGLMFGSKTFLSISGTADENVQRVFSQALSVQNQARDNGAIAKDDDFISNNLCYTVDHHTYGIDEKVKVEAELQYMPVRPYLGIGFGRSIPNKRVGFQFEIGAWYHGSFTMKSENEIPYDDWADKNEDVDDVIKMVKGIAFMPQMTFRLTGRIF